jgi:hypothetical protein
VPVGRRSVARIDLTRGADVTSVEIRNPQNSFLASDVLTEVAQLAGRQGVSATIHTAASDERKGEIINTILLGMSSSAAYELLKAVVMRFVGRKDYDKRASVVVDGTLVVFGDLVSHADRLNS